MLLLVFRSTELHRLLERFPGKSFYNVLHPDLKGYWQFFGRVDLGETWFFHAPVPPGTTKDNFDFVPYLLRAVGAEFQVELEHIGFWDLRFAIADSYQNGRIFLAGDAAHSHPPYGGYGINTGSRMRAISAGSSRPRCKAGAGRCCLAAMTPSAGRSSHRPPAISSRRQSRTTGLFLKPLIRAATAQLSTRNGADADLKRVARSTHSNLTIGVRRSCLAREARRVPSEATPSRRGPGITWRRSRFRLAKVSMMNSDRASP
jgi:hypothetical protein